LGILWPQKEGEIVNMLQQFRIMQTATIAESNLALLFGITLQTKAGVHERTTKIRMYKKTVSRLQDKNIISKEKDLPVAIKMKSPASCKL
jgi:hypothetical protein